MSFRDRKLTFRVSQAEAGWRLDQILPAHAPGLSRRRARVLVDLGGVFVEGRRVKIAGRPMRPGEEVTAHIGGALARAETRVGRAARAAEEERLPAYRVVYEDQDLVVVDKPAGLLTAPTPESDRGNLLSLLRRREGAGEIHLVHRLDLRTSGLLLFAKTESALKVLAERFRSHSLVREYLAVVTGAFPEAIAEIARPVGGRPARTRVLGLERLGERATLLRLRLETGRTHQIRIHCRDVGHPVFGDAAYGAPTAHDPPRMALHATCLALPHPRTGAPLDFASPWPEDLQDWLVGLRGRGARSAVSEPG
jgi:23S rRNA pseudouridine1911/1915/1917 synthase